MQPTLETERLILRAFNLDDASRVQKLAGNIEVASTTLSIPYPYPDGAAEDWISNNTIRASNGEGFPFAVTRKKDDALIGCMSLNLSKPDQRGELSYWSGKPYWGHGYATEAAKRVIQFGFEQLELNKIMAAAMAKNPSSSNVMKKIGMKYEGEFKQHIFKWGEFEDLIFFGLTRADYEQLNK
ncbi:GNAT family N-acetyltransferase [Paenibacillus sp. FSL H8-0537]|uniref:GNAT family N-acetyltransferase n=1 Tax=Paenibacillus sp. FSL H8-0537 TaxID=2921399 RepID=UPI003101012C